VSKLGVNLCMSCLWRNAGILNVYLKCFSSLLQPQLLHLLALLQRKLLIHLLQLIFLQLHLQLLQSGKLKSIYELLSLM